VAQRYPIPSSPFGAHKVRYLQIRSHINNPCWEHVLLASWIVIVQLLTFLQPPLHQFEAALVLHMLIQRPRRNQVSEFTICPNISPRSLARNFWQTIDNADPRLRYSVSSDCGKAKYYFTRSTWVHMTGYIVRLLIYCVLWRVASPVTLGFSKHIAAQIAAGFRWINESSQVLMMQVTVPNKLIVVKLFIEPAMYVDGEVWQWAQVGVVGNAKREVKTSSSRGWVKVAPIYTRRITALALATFEPNCVPASSISNLVTSHLKWRKE